MYKRGTGTSRFNGRTSPVMYGDHQSSEYRSTGRRNRHVGTRQRTGLGKVEHCTQQAGNGKSMGRQKVECVEQIVP